ncbi:hypothetical protein [Methanobrevibacter sp.]|uniref:hypothetical protein n=1 Tax=Methanobrevibacter sp. TaxID=66852 RepID=UPI0038684E99
MIDGSAREFINKLYYEDHYVVYKDNKYFLNGCQTKHLENGTDSVRLEVYNLTKNLTVFSITKSTANDCVEAFQDAPIWSGKTFWEIENQMQWVDE